MPHFQCVGLGLGSCECTQDYDDKIVWVRWYLGLFGSIDTERYFWFQKKILDSTNRISSKSMESRPCACAVERYERTVSRNLVSEDYDDKIVWVDGR